MRSPLAYPLNRTADTDVGGAADLQTDIMRFMAILSLCLVAIFALVQSMPLSPAPWVPEPEVEPAPVLEKHTATEPEAQPAPRANVEKPTSNAAEQKAVVLTRPKWVPKYTPKQSSPDIVTAPKEPAPAKPAATPVREPEPSPPAVDSRETPLPEQESAGFSLRFESDAVLTRLVAAGEIGFYAVQQNRARRMSVVDSRISFWNASTPGSFHEMESPTVPTGVRDALARSGADPEAVRWGVTLPGKLKRRLDEILREHDGGSLIIGADGTLRMEPNP